MQLEDYFDFRSPQDVRLTGTQIGIEVILYSYIHGKQTAEEIGRNHPSISLEQIYATILYYFHNRLEVERYLANWLEWNKRVRDEQVVSRQPDIFSLRANLKEREKHSTAS